MLTEILFWIAFGCMLLAGFRIEVSPRVALPYLAGAALIAALWLV